MRQKISLCVVFLVSFLLIVAAVPASAQNTPSYKIVGYFASWNIYDRGYFVTDIPADKLTHINYAFVNVSDSGECLIGDEWADTQFLYPGETDDGQLHGNFRQIQLLKEKYPHLKTLISVGGWSWSDKFSDAALTAESRQKFAKSCVAMMKQYGFDGIDIDWEYPGGGGMNPDAGRPEDTENFTLLLAELRAQIDAQAQQDGTVYLLTIAAPAGPESYSHIQLDKIHPYLDWINLMTYDFQGDWDSTTNFNAPLHAATDDPDAAGSAQQNDEAVLQAYAAAGIPPEKLVMGVPFYGRGWIVAENAPNNGLYQPATGIPDGTWEPGAFDYYDLEANYLPGSYTRYWHEEAQVPWLYSAEEHIMISYDDPESLEAKALFVKDNGYGGVMIWELSQDSTSHALLDALHNTLTTP